MPTDHARIRLTDVRVPHSAIFVGGEGRGLQVTQHFFNQNRIRRCPVLHRTSRSPTPRSASRSSRSPPTRRSSSRWWSCRPSARCCGHSSTRRPGRWDSCTARSRSRTGSMCNYWAEPGGAARLPIGPCRCTAGVGYSRHKPFEHGTTRATASPRAPRRSRCVGSPATCSASWNQRSPERCHGGLTTRSGCELRETSGSSHHAAGGGSGKFRSVRGRATFFSIPERSSNCNDLRHPQLSDCSTRSELSWPSSAWRPRALGRGRSPGRRPTPSRCRGSRPPRTATTAAPRPPQPRIRPTRRRTSRSTGAHSTCSRSPRARPGCRSVVCVQESLLPPPGTSPVRPPGTFDAATAARC